jgi:hypothetical protein
MMLLSSANSAALSQQDSKLVVQKTPIETFPVFASSDEVTFKRIWNTCKDEADRLETLAGRVWIREYSLRHWDQIAIEMEPEISVVPERAFVCDFASDFIAMRTRQDWYEVVDTKVSFPENMTLDDRRFLDLTISDYLNVQSRRIRTIDRESKLLGTRIRVQLPEKMGRDWPTLLDYRLAGWTHTGQWMMPTDMEQWLRILDSFEPISVEVDDSGDTVVTFYQKKAVTKCIWQMAFDSNTFSLKRAFQYRVVNQLEDGTLVCVKAPLFRSMIFTNRETKRKCVVLGSESNAAIHRLDFMVEEDGDIANELFEPESLSSVSLPIIYSPELEAIIAAELEKDTGAKRP